ncbi:uncharacterized protein VTP21DRAFT_8845 [Calcarisporiella thermophila]|uniref:uncharacterized protein n=1 Tax=Calcarisporiella thermophila TaxID=911321 RepID=UPI00374218D7
MAQSAMGNRMQLYLNWGGDIDVVAPAPDRGLQHWWRVYSDLRNTSWNEVASTAKEWEKVWTSILKRPTLPKHRTLRLQILVERVITNSTFPGHDPKCTRCNAPRDTIRHTFFECPELTSVWHWTERCINTISGPLNTQVLSPRNLVLGDLPEAPRTVRHAAQIVFDSVLWQIHRDRIAYHFECIRASPETIILRAKMDIEEAIGAELKKTRDGVIPKVVQSESGNRKFG